MIAGLTLLALAGSIAACGPVAVEALEELAVRVVGGGHLYWSDGASGWTEIPLSLRLRRHWGPSDVVIEPRYTAVAEGLDIAEITMLRPPDPRGVEVVVARIDPAHWQFRAWGRDDWSRAPVAALAEEAGLSLAVNGPYFAEDGPLGLVVSDGVVRNRQSPRRASHFLVEKAGGRPRILNQKKARLGPLDQGIQGFPSIMSGGKTFTYLRTGGLGVDADAVARRTAACIDRDDRVILLVTDDWTAGLSLADLATLLGGLGCIDAMAFDGGGSTAMSMSVGEYRRDVGGFDAVPVVVGIAPR
ncbi:MAG: phosphodiester glycosidase family protein [Deltaproteobacteria bacterium]|nr:phosphodiester glycosidase family protein [Deltaproteobacteria bacterium]